MWAADAFFLLLFSFFLFLGTCSVFLDASLKIWCVEELEPAPVLRHTAKAITVSIT